MHVSEDNQQVIRVEVAVDDPSVPVQQARSGVTAKIYTGYRTSVGYLWLHDVSDAFHRYVSFYLAR